MNEYIIKDTFTLCLLGDIDKHASKVNVTLYFCITKLIILVNCAFPAFLAAPLGKALTVNTDLLEIIANNHH